MRLFTLERQLLTSVFGGLGRVVVVVRLQKHRRQHGWTCPQPSPSLCSRSWWLERGPYSCLVMMKMQMRHTHTCHSQARVRANRDKRVTWMETSLRFSVLSFESCNCHQVFLSLNPPTTLNGTTRMKTFLLSCGTMRQSSWRRIGGQP